MSQERKTILIIDDEVDFLNSVKTLLDQEGYNAIIATDGDAGLAQAKALTPYMIICDLTMPKKNGFEVLSEAKKDENLRRVPFIMLTASHEFKDAKKAYQDKADLYITKPLDPFVLLQDIITLESIQRASENK